MAPPPPQRVAGGMAIEVYKIFFLVGLRTRGRPETPPRLQIKKAALRDPPLLS